VEGLSDMAGQPYIVIRLVPESPVDGTTFGTYLDGLTLDVINADTNTSLSQSPAEFSSLALFEWPPGSGWYLTITSAPTSSPPPAYDKSANNFGKVLNLVSTEGISAGSFIFSADQTTIPASGLHVTNVTPGSVTLSGDLPNSVPPGTAVPFIGQPGAGDVATAPGYATFSCTPSSALRPARQPHCTSRQTERTGSPSARSWTRSRASSGPARR
jgi:hypothetical protein